LVAGVVAFFHQGAPGAPVCAATADTPPPAALSHKAITSNVFCNAILFLPPTPDRVSRQGHAFAERHSTCQNGDTLSRLDAFLSDA
jgi:hypothetical protein